MSTATQTGTDMRSIYIRSLLFAAGLAAFAAIELLAPRSVDAGPPMRPALGALHAPA